MRRPVGCGIDFGTSNSAISIAFDDGSVDLVQLGSRAMPFSLPSLIYIHRDGNEQTGDGAVQEYLLTGANRTQCFGCERANYGRDHDICQHYGPFGKCNDSRLMQGLKFDLANEYIESTHSWGRDYSVERLVSVVLKHLKVAAEGTVGMAITNVVLGKPFGFVGAEVGGDFHTLQSLAVNRVIQGAQLAGFSTIETMYEAEAASQIEQPPVGYTAVLDFGGGTFDVAVLSRESHDSSVRVIGLQGAPIGGDEFDGLLFEEYVWEQLGVRKADLPSWKRLRTMNEVRWLLSDESFRHELAVLRRRGVDTSAIDAILFGGHAYRFYQQIENAKLQLSDRDEAQILFQRPGMSVDATVTRSGFEELIELPLDRVEAAIGRALDEARVAGAEVEGVMLTGGSSFIPAFRQRMTAVLPNARVLEVPAFTATIEGLGRKAVSLWS